jgi:dipeptidyl aminopeptidase/acylaminoacyl peptidase
MVRTMRRIYPLVVFASAMLSTQQISAQKRPFDIDALLKIKRISEPQISPDGRWVAFTVQTVDVAQNTKPKHIYIVSVDGNGPPRPLTREGNNERPKWTPDSKRILFTSTRTSGSQIWSMDRDGVLAEQITHLSTEATGVTVSPDGKRIVFLSSVYPECADDACNKARLDAEAASKSKARVYTSLLYRHWNEWQGRRRSHLMSANIDGTAVKDLTPGNRDVPPFSLGGPDDYAISPDNAEVAYVINNDENPALSTNSDIYVVPIGGGEAKRVTTNPAADNSPLYSPDGKYLAFRSQQRPGYESDRWRLIVLDRATGHNEAITESVDRNVTSFAWTPDGKGLFIVTEDRGRHNIQQIAVSGGGLRPIITGPTSLDDIQFAPNGKTIIYTEMSASKPVEIYKASSGGSGLALTHLNDDFLNDYTLTPLQEVSVDGAEETKVYGFISKPPDFDPKKKYPVLFLIHGGPQGAWGETWSYRWNPLVFASAGFVVVMPNPRGSTGYGQKFSLRGHHGHGRLRSCPAMGRCRAHGRGRGIVWRLHGQLDARPYQSLQGICFARRRLRSAQHGR